MLVFAPFQRIGYLAATQSFHDEVDVIMLTTNMIKKVSSLCVYSTRILFLGSESYCLVIAALGVIIVCSFFSMLFELYRFCLLLPSPPSPLPLSAPLSSPHPPLPPLPLSI